MKRKFLALLALGYVLTAAPVPAQESGVRAEERAALMEALASARSEQIAKAAERAIWELWMDAPDAQAQALLDAAIARMRVADNAGAIDLLDTLVRYAPDYAEGWNQRAFAHFRMQNFDRSLEDIEETLTREPRHFGALSGKWRILVHQGRAVLAQDTLRRAVEIHPFLAERAMLAPEAEPGRE